MREKTNAKIMADVIPDAVKSNIPINIPKMPDDLACCKDP